MTVADMKIAVMLGNLKMDPYEGMKKVVAMEVPGLHLSIGGGPFAPENMDKSARTQLLEHIRSLGLEVSAVSAWGGNVDLGDADEAEHNIAWARRILDMSVDLECSIWQAHVGVMPTDTSDPRWSVFIDSTGQIAQYGESVGACLAIETGPEPPKVLKRLIEDIGSVGLRVNYDPANLILWPVRLFAERGEEYDRKQAWAEFQPMAGVKVLGEYIVHTHAKDALVRRDGTRKEVPLGSGWVDWPVYVQSLMDEGYEGYYAIERETGEDPVGDITRAVEFLKSIRPGAPRAGEVSDQR
jgi:sugar phosphate isomerase/epimerase